MAVHVQPRTDQQDHGDADPAHIGFDAQQHAQEVADDDAGKRADRQQCHTIDDHCCCPQVVSKLLVVVLRHQ
ncbi:hypothetical protein D3C75_751630 [compost metagenome]